jgi:hypothetical protein
MIQPMKRILAAMTAGVVIGLAGTMPASAQDTGPAPAPRATLHVTPGWTYAGDGKLAVTASCSQRGDVPVVGSKMFSRPVTLRKGPNLLVKVSDKTHPQKYTINLFCTGKHQQVDAVAMKKVRILKLLGGFWQPDAPGLPKHFKPGTTVTTGPPPKAKHH